MRVAQNFVTWPMISRHFTASEHLYLSQFLNCTTSFQPLSKLNNLHLTFQSTLNLSYCSSMSSISELNQVGTSISANFETELPPFQSTLQLNYVFCFGGNMFFLNLCILFFHLRRGVQLRAHGHRFMGPIKKNHGSSPHRPTSRSGLGPKIKWWIILGFIEEM